MDVETWTSLIADINNEFYALLLDRAQCGPFDGGCVAVAYALQNVVDGEVVVLVRSDNFADHAAVLKDELLWDYDGPLPPGEFISRFNKNEMLKGSSQCVRFRSIEHGDLDEAYRDPELEERISALFDKALGGSEIKPKII